MSVPRRSLCIVSRDPLQCSELVLSLQASLEPDDEVEIIMDRRRPRGVFETESVALGPRAQDRRRNTAVDLEVQTKGFSIVPREAQTSRAPDEPDADDRARFESILSFKRRRGPRPGRMVGAASALMVALVLTPPLSFFPDAVSPDVPSSPAPQLGQLEPTSASQAPPVSVRKPPAEAPATSARSHASPPVRQVAGPRPSRPQRSTSAQATLEAYAARIENATGRAVSKARVLMDRVKSEVIGNMPMSAEPGVDVDPINAKPRPPDSP